VVVSALVAAAGAGERLGGDRAKALIELRGRPLVAWCLAALASSSRVDSVVVAAPPDLGDEVAVVVAEAAPGMESKIVAGGASRSGSVANALEAATGASIVLVHDAARPLVTAELIDACVERLEQWRCDGVVAATPATDTIKLAEADGRVSATLERSRLWAVQTPQVFRASVLREALDTASVDEASDDAQLVEAIGGEVRIVEAPRENLKVTTELDLQLAELLLRQRGC
jgi:2-C-methyl-D-erythritol 4-phosphate cytidylyltransferase